MERAQREWFRSQFKAMAAAGKEHKPLRKDYHRAYQKYYDLVSSRDSIKEEVKELDNISLEKFRKWQSHDYSSGKFTALLNIYHLLKRNEVCTYHKYKLGGDYYSHNWYLKKWLDSGLIDGFTGEMADRLLQDWSEQQFPLMT